MSNDIKRYQMKRKQIQGKDFNSIEMYHEIRKRTSIKWRQTTSNDIKRKQIRGTDHDSIEIYREIHKRTSIKRR